jgi:3-oxoacyl-[acyl-carrier protein] reductase
MEAQSRVALVVGGSRGIGRAVVLRLAASGFDIWLTYRDNHAAAAATRDAVVQLGRTCRLMAFDLAQPSEIRRVLVPVVEERCPDVLVYNAGVARDNVLALMQVEEWDAVLRTNLDGFFHVTQPVVFGMLPRKRGRIVIISSISGQVGQAGQVNYSASKAGLIGAARALAREVGRKQIFVNVVAPGVIETEMTQHIPKEMVLPLIPLQRYGTVDEVAAVVHFLCTEPQMYVHGQVIGVNGGMA